MNLPNKLTIIRVILIPFFLVFMLVEKIPMNYFLALAIFIIASVTDALDGKIARKHNLVTNFGKFLDPLADKALVMSAIVVFIELGWIGSIPVIIILGREFMVTSLRLVANKSGGKVIAAGFSGKLKTAFTMIAIIAILIMQGIENNADYSLSFDIDLIGNILIWIATALTVYSGCEYLWNYRDCIDPSK